MPFREEPDWEPVPASLGYIPEGSDWYAEELRDAESDKEEEEDPNDGIPGHE